MRFLLIDRYESFERGTRAVGVKAVTAGAEYLWDHFPGNPVFPGVLVVEALAQTAGGLLAISSDFAQFGLMTMIRDAKFRDFVRPGRLLHMEVAIESRDATTARVRGVARVADREIARAALVFVLVPLRQVIGARFADAWAEYMRSLLPPDPGERAGLVTELPE